MIKEVIERKDKTLGGKTRARSFEGADSFEGEKVIILRYLCLIIGYFTLTLVII